MREWMAVRVLLVLSYLCLAHDVMAQEWPSAPLPQRLQTFDIGEQMSVNGLPMRIKGFLSPLGSAVVAQSFREAWGQPLMENTVGRQLVMGQLRGEHYFTVQIEGVGKGTRGVIAITHLKAAYDTQEQAKLDRERWQTRLPAGSRILSRMTSQDGSRLSNQLVFENAHSENLNRENLAQWLAQDGFVLQNTFASEGGGTANSLGKGHLSLFFKGQNKEAIATVSRNSAGLTTTVLNIVTMSN